MNLDDLHTRFSAYMQKIENDVYMVTNHNYSIIKTKNQDEFEAKFKVASTFAILKLYRNIAIIFEEVGVEEINLIPEILTRYVDGEEFKNLNIIVEDPLDKSRKFKTNNFFFTGRIYIECHKLKNDKNILYDMIDSYNFRYLHFPLYITIRSTEDYMNEDNLKLKKIFLCHDHHDKEIVSKVASELSKRLYDVWFDNFSISPGDSLYQKISEGLSTCDNGLLFLSKQFLKNDGWVKFELQSLVNKQIFEKKKVIIPVWLDIEVKDLSHHHWLRDKLAVIFSGNVKSLIDEVERGIS